MVFNAFGVFLISYIQKYTIDEAVCRNQYITWDQDLPLKNLFKFLADNNHTFAW